MSARAVTIATGARYRKLILPNSENVEHERIRYAATAIESARCSGEDVIVVGGGNSTGQAALDLSAIANHVHLVV